MNNNLPSNWSWVKLGDLVKNPKDDIVDGPFGSNLKATEYKPSGTPIIRLQNIGRNYFVNKNIKFITKQKAIELKRHSYIPGDIIITKLGDPLGEACEIPKTFESGIIVADLVRLRLTEKKVDKKFLIYSINSDYVAKQFKIKTKGTTRPRVNLTHVRSLEIKLPPLPEQKKIVEKIEELFSGLDSGVASLKKAKEQIRLYKQSVLSAAFSDRLTQNVKQETKEELEAHLNGVQGAAKAAEPKVEYRNNLPEGWKWVKLGEVCHKIGDVDHKMPKPVENGKYPYLSTKDFTDDLKIDFKKAKLISEEDFNLLSRKIKPQKGDIIFPRYGTIGKNVLVDCDKEFLVSYSCAVIKPNTEKIVTKYLYHYSLSPLIQKEIKKYTVQTTQANVGIESIKNFIVPLPSLIQQTQIVEEIEKRFSEADNLEKAIDESLTKSETLRKSILKQAFGGKLIMNN